MTWTLVASRIVKGFTIIYREISTAGLYFKTKNAKPKVADIYSENQRGLCSNFSKHTRVWLYCDCV